MAGGAGGSGTFVGGAGGDAGQAGSAGASGDPGGNAGASPGGAGRPGTGSSLGNAGGGGGADGSVASPSGGAGGEGGSVPGGAPGASSGGGGGGSGGDGVKVAASLTLTSPVRGGPGGFGGAGASGPNSNTAGNGGDGGSGGAGLVATIAGLSINSGGQTIRGGSGGAAGTVFDGPGSRPGVAGAAGAGGVGVIGRDLTLVNTGTISGGFEGGVASGARSNAVNFSGASFLGLGAAAVFNGALSVAGTLTFDQRLAVGESADIVLAAKLTGAGAIVKVGAGVLTLSSATSDLAGGATLIGGTLELTAAGVIGSGAITFGAGAQKLQLDGRRAGGAFANTLSGLGLGDMIDVQGVGVATSAVVAANTLVLKNGAATLFTLNLDAATATALATQSFTLASDGAAGTLLTLAAPAVVVAVVAPTPTPPSPVPTPSTSAQANLPTQTLNILRLDPDSADAKDPTSPLYAQLQAAKAIEAKLDSGKISLPDAQLALFHLVDATTSLAVTEYAFFTSRIPSAAGLNYLVHSDVNKTDLNDPQYQSLSTENRYINMAVGLGTGQGEGAKAFSAGYDGLTLTQAATKAYQAVFSVTPSTDKIAAILNDPVPDGRGGTETRAQYLLDVSGGSTIAQKAAFVGFLLSYSIREGLGTYQQANLHFLQDLAHGTPAYNVDLLTAYGSQVPLVGGAVVDPTAPH